MKLFGKKKKETDNTLHITETELQMLILKGIEDYHIRNGYKVVPVQNIDNCDLPVLPFKLDANKTFESVFNPDKVLKYDMGTPIKPVTVDLSIDNIKKPKRKYTKRNKEFWGSKKTAQDEEPKEDTLRVFRQRQAAGSILTPEEFAKIAHEGDVYYIPYNEEGEYSRQQCQYTGRVCNRLRTKVSTLYAVNSQTHKAENLMKIECLKK